MNENNNVKRAYALAVVLLIVGIICYAKGGSGLEPGEEPVRKVYKGLAGDVLFDHQEHAYEYESDCYVCHHHGDSAEFMACDVCHKEETPKQVPAVCNDCHPLSGDTYVFDEHHRLLEDEPEAWTCTTCHQKEEGESLPYACGDCHDPYDPYFAEAAARIEMTYEKTDAAFHSQCIGCHKDYSAGPVECGECHAQ